MYTRILYYYTYVHALRKRLTSFRRIRLISFSCPETGIQEHMWQTYNLPLFDDNRTIGPRVSRNAHVNMFMLCVCVCVEVLDMSYR